MTASTKTHNLALFCDFENIALGVRDARYAAFDIGKVLERLLLKGNIVVKKAYCDWERYKDFNGLENNSPDLSNNQLPYSPSGPTIPDNEDLNIDNCEKNYTSFINAIDRYRETFH